MAVLAVPAVVDGGGGGEQQQQLVAAQPLSSNAMAPDASGPPASGSTEPYAVGTELVLPFRKHMCKENDSIASVVGKMKLLAPTDRARFKGNMLAINRKLLFGPALQPGDKLKARTVLLIPDAVCEPMLDRCMCTVSLLKLSVLWEGRDSKFAMARGELQATVTKYLGLFDQADVTFPYSSEIWEATDSAGGVYRMDALTLYQGMGYDTNPAGAYMGWRVARCFGGVESVGVVVGRTAGEMADDLEVWVASC